MVSFLRVGCYSLWFVYGVRVNFVLGTVCGWVS